MNGLSKKDAELAKLLRIENLFRIKMSDELEPLLNESYANEAKVNMALQKQGL